MKIQHQCVSTIVILLFSLSSCNKHKGIPPSDDVEIIHLLNDRLTNVIMQDGFTPPVAARIYAYSNVVAYEAAVLNTEDTQPWENSCSSSGPS